MVTILVVGLLVWVVKGAAEDVVRAWRGEPSTAPRGGFRGYANDRWKALADHHHAVAESGMLTRGDARQARKHLARTKALKLAGFATDEDVARAKAEHQHRLGFITKGIDPDTMPPLFPKRGQVWEPPADGPVLEAEPEAEPEPAEAGVSIDDHFYTSAEVWINPEYFPPEPNDPSIDAPEPDAQDQPWNPFESSSTDTKETTTVSTGEINGPADVNAFRAAIAAVIAQAVTVADNLVGTATDLSKYADDFKHNIAATETAAAGMSALEIENAAAAARALGEIQETMRAALATIANVINDNAGILTDQAEAAGTHIAVIDKGYQNLVRMQEARVAAGKGNVHKDAFLDND